jgi:hypothetical protein
VDTRYRKTIEEQNDIEFKQFYANDDLGSEL